MGLGGLTIPDPADANSPNPLGNMMQDLAFSVCPSS